MTRLERKEAAKRRVAKEQVQQDMDRLVALTSELQRLLINYHSSLAAAEEDEESKIKEVKKPFTLKLAAESPVSSHAKRIRRISQFVTSHVEALRNSEEQEEKEDDEKAEEDDLGEKETAKREISKELLTETDGLFRGVCRVLQDMVHALCKLYKQESQQEAVILIDCADTCLLALKELRLQRAALFDQVRQQSGQNTTPMWISPFQAVVSFIGEKISSLTKPIMQKEADQENPIGDSSLAHMDVDLGPTMSLVRLVVECIAVASTNQNVKLNEAEEKVADLLNVLPEGVKPDSRTLLTILETLCHVGTLEAAQECRRIFDVYSPEVPHLPFSLVLRGYLEASRRETIHERKHEIVQEILEAFRYRWDSDLPRHRMERIAQGSSVLHCISVSGVSKDPEIMNEADSVFKRSLGSAIYHQVRKGMTSVNGEIDSSAVPLVNYLARAYATSGDVENVKTAKLMVGNIIAGQRDNEDSRRFIKYPNVETINALLEGILKLHQERADGLDEDDDLTFADSLLEFAMSRRESQIWPNTQTFDLIMNLLTILKPSDVGKRMENLVSHYETRMYLTQQPGGMEIPLATYNRVIWGLWEEAKNESACRTSQRALVLLEKLEMLSTPLLLKRKQVLNIENIKLYQFNLRPSFKTYELVLSVCEATAAPSEYEMAAKIAHAVGSRLLYIDKFTPTKAVEKVRMCLERLPEDSKLASPMRELLQKLEDKAAAPEQQGDDEDTEHVA